jgi:type I restriction enzyme R subunit
MDLDTLLDKELIIQFIKNSQPQSWAYMENIFGDNIEEGVVERLNHELEKSSMIEVLRNGFYVYELHIDCAYFKPKSKRNPESETLYNSNILSVISQARYSKENDKALDILLCLNGLPVASAEVKNPATGQNYEDAIRQYKLDRDANERLFQFPKRTMVHFAVDPYEVHVSTKLEGKKTNFLPFNKGRDEGRGNPDHPTSYRTSYLWESIWQRDLWLEIIADFINLERIRLTSSSQVGHRLIFPRYHQLETVSKLTEATRKSGPGVNYLIQHSTGSGKSNTICWLSYKLFTLHTNEDIPVFDTVIILSDRIGIKNQLASTLMEFEQTPGTVQSIETSADLVENLESQRKILVTTQQKFPFVIEKIQSLKGNKFAIIIDEAHSSQSGEGAKKVKDVLTNNYDNEPTQNVEESDEDLVDRIEKQMARRGSHKNLSYYAFTATPTEKTFTLFGTKGEDGHYQPFNLYSMKQAIEEGFIFDVLKNYTTYERYFQIIQTATVDKIVDSKKASRRLMKYIDTHQLNLSQKSEKIIEHFRIHCQPKIGELAKAMVVTSSIEQAFLYKRELDYYIKSKKYPRIKSLIAFSGTFEDEFGKKHTEESINKISGEQELRDKFMSPEYNILVVAEKYQTGFDQPLLHTMYVDKKLRGVRAVQTLSRINRICPGKTETFVLDFKNTIQEITEAYKPYYQGTTLVDKSDSTSLIRLFSEIMNYQIITISDLDKFAKLFFKAKSLRTIEDHGMLYALMNPILDRFTLATELEQDNFKTKIKRYIEEYSFLSQVSTYTDSQLEKLYALSRFIVNQDIIKGISTQLPELKGDVSLQWYRLEKTFEGQIGIEGKEKPIVKSENTQKQVRKPEVLTPLSEIIRLLNEKYSDFELTEAEKLMIEDWLKNLKQNLELREFAKKNDFDDFLRVYELKFQEQIMNSVENYDYLVSKIFADNNLKQKIMGAAARSYHDWVKSNDLPPIQPSTPYENRLHFRETIRGCNGYIFWIDRYIGKDGLEFLLDAFNRATVKKIRIISSLYNNEYQINQSLRDKIVEYQNELKNRGISLEMKVATSKAAYDRIPHDRFMLAENAKYNIPSFSTIIKGSFSEIKRTRNTIPFDSYWNDKEVLDVIKDWNQIQEILKNSKKSFVVHCANCGVVFQVSFEPRYGQKLYCKKCRFNK